MAGLTKTAVDALRSTAAPMLVVGMEYTGDIIATAPMMWTGQAEVDGPDIELSGSIGEIIGNLSDMNPNYIKEQAAIQRERVRDEPEKQPTQIECKVSGKPVHLGPKLCLTARLQLAFTGGYCSVPPGQCSIISCQFNCGLYLCNEEGSEARVPCRQLADDILGIEEKCTKTTADGDVWTKGQAKHADTQSLRTVVKHASCGSQEFEAALELASLMDEMKAAVPRCEIDYGMDDDGIGGMGHDEL